jgi:hypothetical protein
MKKLQVIAAAALLAAMSAGAQTTYEPAVPRGIADTMPPQSQEIAQPPASAPAAGAQVIEPKVPPKLVTSNWRHQSDADARRCLQFSSNRQIHRCAERYRPHTRHVSVKRTKAAKSKASAAAPALKSQAASDLSKTDLSKTTSPAKPIEAARPAAPSSPPSTASVIQKPTVTPPPAPPAKAAASGDAKPPKWTDKAKGVVKSQGDHLPD